ncbi:unnamed protein product, partial [Heterosigma akashiwo]
AKHTLRSTLAWWWLTPPDHFSSIPSIHNNMELLPSRPDDIDDVIGQQEGSTKKYFMQSWGGMAAQTSTRPASNLKQNNFGAEHYGATNHQFNDISADTGSPLNYSWMSEITDPKGPQQHRRARSAGKAPGATGTAMVGGSGSVGSGGGARGGILLSQLDSDGDLEEGQGSYQAMDGQWNSGASSPKVPAEGLNKVSRPWEWLPAPATKIGGTSAGGSTRKLAVLKPFDTAARAMARVFSFLNK